MLAIVKVAGSGSSHHAASAPSASGVAATLAAAGSSAALPGTGAGALPAFGLVGGGGVTARPAAGKLASKGSAGDVLFAEDGTVLDASALQVVSGAAGDPPAASRGCDRDRIYRRDRQRRGQ